MATRSRKPQKRKQLGEVLVDSVDDQLPSTRKRTNIKSNIESEPPLDHSKYDDDGEEEVPVPGGASRQVSTNIQPQVVQSTPGIKEGCQSTNVTPLNMRMRNDMNGIKMLVRNFSRESLFRYTKFWDESLEEATPRIGGLPFLVSSNCNMSQSAVLEGWKFYSKILQRAHTDQRNNVIKKSSKRIQECTHRMIYSNFSVGANHSFLSCC